MPLPFLAILLATRLPPLSRVRELSIERLWTFVMVSAQETFPVGLDCEWEIMVGIGKRIQRIVEKEVDDLYSFVSARA